MSPTLHIDGRWVVMAGIAAVGAGLLAGIGFLAWSTARQETARCADNLRTIHEALIEYQQQAGQLPELAFFPDDAQLDPDSLYAELAPFGVQPVHCLCPSAPDTLRGTGMTYIWNVSLNGVHTDDLSGPTWMLVDVQALSPSVRAPHHGAYNVLFSDGTIRAADAPPPMP